LPLSGIMVGNVVTVDGESEDDPPSRVYLNSVWPGYFATMGIPILRGRDFADADGPGAGRVVIVNETLAGQLWPGRDPIGQRLHLGSAEDVGEPWSEVVGVAQDNKYDELTEPPRPFLYLSHMQGTAIRTELTLIARTTGDPSKLAPALRAALQAVEADLPLFDMATLEQFVDRRNDKQRGTSTMLAVFGALALMLACMGIYAVVAQSVLGRTREIGVRLAMGARPADILRLFVGQGLRLSLIGVAIGLVLSAGLTRAVSHMLFGITPTDMATFAGVSILLAAVAAGASWLPARRALRVDPMTALRYE
ncbi:MAG TPA: FtsX-like permease family protein, partial [Candidatus Polarisedimenticolia bacterium]|nr:FtsX-like permease family protein [Candidatus Polarisedimenticolia bacterium]